jgi:cell division septal protein FtsQ
VRYRRPAAVPRRLPSNRRKPNYLLMFCVLVLVFVVVGSASYVFTTPKLNVAKVEIKGVRLADAKAIEKTASRAIGHNIILMRTGPILKEVRGLSEIRLAKMGRKFPNRVWLRVWERKADAVIAGNGGLYLVQSDGFVFHQVNVLPKNVPLVQATGLTQLKPGQTVCSPSIKCALQVLEIARKQRIKLGKISVDPQGDICLNMGSDFCAKLGQPDDIALKMSLLRHSLVQRPSIVREGAYIDLSCPSAPVWKRKVASLSAS